MICELVVLTIVGIIVLVSVASITLNYIFSSVYEEYDEDNEFF